MQSDINALLKLNDDQLYAQLAQETGKGFGPSDLPRLGREIYENASASVAKIICTSDRIKALYNSGNSGNAELASAIVDCIIGYLQGVPVATVAVLIAKQGLPKLCKVYWSDNES